MTGAKGIATKRWTHAALTAALLALSSCGEPPVIDTSHEKKNNIKENTLNANRYLIEREETNINSYIDRRGWEVTQLPCGVRIHVMEHGEGKRVAIDERVSIAYKVETLSGQQIYGDTIETITAGWMQPNEGVDAAVQALHYGDKAHVIVPAAAAYGVAGDGNRIAPRTALVYTIKISES